MATPACLAQSPGSVVADEALMLAYAAGDATAFDALYARHKGGVYRYVLRHCGRAAAADELFQDIWLNVIRVRASYAPSARFATWLYRIAHNRIVDYWRAAGHIELVTGDGEDDDPLDALPGPTHVQPEQMAEANELRTRVAAAIAALPPLQRDAFLLHQEGGLTLQDIAALTGAGIETVKSRLRYAGQRLRAMLEDVR